MSKNIEVIRETFSKVGPTSDNSSRIARIKKVQVRVGTTQLFGLNQQKGNVTGSSGHAWQKTYFTGIFPRLSFK